MSSKNICITREKVLQESAEELAPPSMYKIVILNDDYTPMEFVVEILMTCFFVNKDEATSIMLAVHNDGKAVYGLYTKDVAETKMTQINSISRSSGYPLLCIVEKE